jgi:hypothetical protein
MDVIPSSSVSGMAKLYYLDARAEHTEWQKNLVLYSWQEILAGLLSSGDSRFRLSGMYLEFENKLNPDAAVDLPTFDRTRDLSYYNSLSVHPTRDFLRVGVLGSGVTVNQQTTTVQLFASTSGAVGIHGKVFTNAANSTVIGASLVSIPEAADRTQDVLFSSIYFAPDKQKLKLANGDIGLTWQINLQ